MTIREYLSSDDQYEAAQELANDIANETGCPLVIGETHLSDWICEGDIEEGDTFKSIASEWVEQ